MAQLEIAKQFAGFYYSTFDANRANLLPLYRDNSMLTWESNEFLGARSIVEKIGQLPFQKIQHDVKTCDAQPSNDKGGLLVFITGLLIVDEGTNPLQFSQVFQLLPDESTNGFWVFNDIFRLNYG